MVSTFILLIILGLLIGIIMPNFMGGIRCNMKINRVAADFRSFDTILKLYYLDNAAYPTTEQGLSALVEIPNVAPMPEHWRKYLERVPVDPWGNAYHYRSPGQHGLFDIFTLGADGIVGGEGPDRDRGSWEELNLD